MEPPFRMRSDLVRLVEGGFAFPLGVEHGGLRPQQPGWAVEHRPAGETVCSSLTYTIVVSHELVRPLVRELMRLLPDQLCGILELGSRDAYREVDVFLGEPISRDAFLGPWELFETLLLEDATLGVGVNAPEPLVEIFLDHDKRLFIHVDPVFEQAVESVLTAWRIPRRRRPELDARVHTPVMTRPVLRDLPRSMVDTDHLLAELRMDWKLHLDEDPDRNLDGRGRELGETLWRAILLVDQEDPAGRRQAHAHVWAVAGSRREMQIMVDQAMRSDVEWEFQMLLSMDRVAFDDRPQELNALLPQVADAGVLLYRVDPVGTVAGTWDERDG